MTRAVRPTRRALLLGALAGAVARPATPAPHTFGWRGEQFLLDGEPFVIRSGEMHYPRVPRAYWRDRMRKMRALGLNTLCTYVFWDLHEPEPGKFDFSGDLDLAEYLRVAQSEGLWVLLRPGPYICSEWDFGALPAWLLATPGLKVRSGDQRFLAAAGRYLKRVGQEVAALEIARGGPILMVQVENEYGSYGSDHDYMRATQKAIRDAGFAGQLYTSDGSGARNLAGGTLDDAIAVINFGDNANLEREFAGFAKFRQNVPRMCGEYWVGWFDHWGEKHHTTPAARAAAGVEWMLSRGISVNLYMVHGGSSTGYMGGANYDRVYEPIISAYDYDSPLDEAGRPTEKFRAIQAVMRKYSKDEFPALPEPLPTISIPRFELTESAPLPVEGPASEGLLTMEQIHQSYGFVRYSARLGRARKGTLEIREMHDYAIVMQGAKRLGVLDRRLDQTKLAVDLNATEPLTILVENMGRANFGARLPEQWKGIQGKVLLDSEEIRGWQTSPMPLANPSSLRFSRTMLAAPALYRGTFQAADHGDTFLDLRGWGKGLVWVNGRLLGRYWRIGPQQSLFLPAPWMKPGANEVIVLDLEDGRARSLQASPVAVYETAG